ncbi:MAG: DUF3352 domain-containing protein [Phycisphaerae bacterium]|nr:DUF3352 domain-containing protein [Phycisphaerae bacterium]
MKTSAAFALTLLLCVAPAGAADPPAVADFLPEDTIIAMVVGDVPALREQGEKHPLARAWNDPQIQRFIAPMRAKMKVDTWDQVVTEATGHSLEDLLALPSGQAAVAITHLPLGNRKDQPHLVMALDIGDQGKVVEDLLARGLAREQEAARRGVQIVERLEEFQGHLIHARRRIKDGDVTEREAWVVVDNWFLVANPKDLLKQTIRRLEKKVDDRVLSDAANFKQVRQRQKRAHALAYIDLQAMVKIGQGVAERRRAERGQPENPLALTPERAVKVMGLDALRGAYFTTEVTDAATTFDVGVFYTEQRGLLKLLAFQPGKVDKAAFIPDDAIAANTFRFSIPQVWDTLRETLNGLNPMMGAMAAAPLNQIKAQTGVDLENDLIKNIGDDFASASMLRKPDRPGEAQSLAHMSDVYVMSLNDSRRFEDALGALIDRAPGAAALFKEREYLGTTIRTLELPQEPVDPDFPDVNQLNPNQSISWTVTDRHFMLGTGTPAMMESVLVGMNGGGRSIWEKPEVAGAIEGVAADASALGFTDTATVLNAGLQFAGTFQKIMRQIDESELLLVDFDAIPDSKLMSKYFGPTIGSWHVEKTGQHSRTRLLHAQPEGR